MKAFINSGDGDDISGITQEFYRKVGLHDEADDRPISEADSDNDDNDEDKEEEEEEEFSFTPARLDSSPTSADDMFHDGFLRPVFPVFDRDLIFSGHGCGDSEPPTTSAIAPPRSPVRKLFYERSEPPTPSPSDSGDVSGPYCEWWTGKLLDAPECCRKSSSTGFSKLWRFRDMVRRSSSDGRDAFVVLSPKSRRMAAATARVKTTNKKRSIGVGDGKVKAKGKGGAKGKTSSSSLSPSYAKNREARGKLKRRSYLPYRLGFFTNVDGMSRNVHPF